MSWIQTLNHWANLPFLVMLGLVLVFFALQVAGLLGGDADGDHDADHDHDVDHDHDADHDHDGGFAGAVMAFFGIGRVPFMVVWLTFFIVSGFTGITLNRLLLVRGTYAWWWFVLVLAAAVVLGAIAVSAAARLAGKLVDNGGKGSTSKRELVGLSGVVASVRVDAAGGEIRVREPDGDEHLIQGRTQGEEPAIPRGARVVLVDHEPERDVFWVTASPEV